MTESEIYQLLSKRISESITEDWEKAIANLTRVEGSVGFSGKYFTIDGTEKNLEASFDFFDGLAVHELYSITTEDGKSKWKNLAFNLFPTGKFETEFIWDQEAIDNQLEKVQKNLALTKTMFNKLYDRLPKEESDEDQLKDKTLEQLYSLCKDYLNDSSEPLWDCSLIRIQRDESNNYTGDLFGIYAESAEDLKNGYTISEEKSISKITHRMKSIYEALQMQTKLLHPTFRWDAVIISLYNDDCIEANYEKNGEEVYWDE